MANKYTVDEKDRVDHPDAEEPENYHVITCRDCGKKRKTSKKFRLTCDSCRTKRKYRNNHSDFSGWQNWDDITY